MIYPVLEYIIFPIIAVLLTFMVRAIMSSKRIEKKEVMIDLGYDVMIMSTFGLMLCTIGTYGHFHKADLGFVAGYGMAGCFIAFTSLCGLMGITFYDKLSLNTSADEQIRLHSRYRLLSIMGISYIILLVSFVMYGIYLEQTMQTLKQ